MRISICSGRLEELKTRILKAIKSFCLIIPLCAIAQARF